MRKVFGISGPQGAGKSTLLSALQDRGYVIDNFKVSRSIQEEFGWDSLDRVKDDPLAMMRFQNEIFARKFAHEQALSDTVIFTERTFADIFAYTADWTKGFIQAGRLKADEALAFLSQYKAKCTYAQKLCYEGAIFLPFMHDTVKFQADAHRASEDKVTEIEDAIFNFFTENQLPFKRITAKSVQDRVDQVQQIIKEDYGV